MKKLVFSIGVLCLFAIYACENNTTTDPPEPTPLQFNSFQAIDMPSVLSIGGSFPTDSNTVNGWVANSTVTNDLETNEDIIKHGWGIWQALTQMTDQRDNNQPLRRFETWYTPQDVINGLDSQSVNSNAGLANVIRNTGDPHKPHQFHTSTADVSAFVKYSPAAAQHAFENKLFYKSTMEALLAESGPNTISNIPDFPDNSVTLKPVFYPLHESNKVPGEADLYRVPIWPGNNGDPTRSFGPSAWNNDVFVTINGPSEASKDIYSINDFINFQLDSAQAASFVDIFDNSTVKSGDHALLLAMHVSTRENKRWTWQTFWWSHSPDSPKSPSSSTTAALRSNAQLDKAANHYAMAIAYNMVNPAQPYVGGSGEGADKKSIYAFNPYLEASFAPTDGPFVRATDTIAKYPSINRKIGKKLNQYGMQTNCMSCHGQARYISSLPNADQQIYVADEYIDLAAPYFKNTVKLDFAWSVRGSLVLDK